MKECEICKGKCCKTIPGKYFLKDIFKDPKNMTKNELYDFLNSNCDTICIDYWFYKKERIYFIRPRTKIEIEKVFQHTILFHKGTKDLDNSKEWCIYLTETGCSLEKEKRPSECNMVEPIPEEHDCKVKTEKGNFVGCVDYYLNLISETNMYDLFKLWIEEYILNFPENVNIFNKPEEAVKTFSIEKIAEKEKEKNNE